MRFNIVIGPAELADEPTARNSNLLPVKANGEVRLRSVLSLNICGIFGIPCHKSASSFIFLLILDVSISSSTSLNWLPRNIDIIAGGASLAPRRWSLFTDAMDALSRSACSDTAFMVFTKKVRNIRLFFGVLPGDNKFLPVLVIIDQLLCLPEPLMPAYGFSCSSTLKLWRLATLSIKSINNWLWSIARLISSYIGAHSNCDGATSLCLVFKGIPNCSASV